VARSTLCATTCNIPFPPPDLVSASALEDVEKEVVKLLKSAVSPVSPYFSGYFQAHE
jgi:hypothetical protein